MAAGNHRYIFHPRTLFQDAFWKKLNVSNRKKTSLYVLSSKFALFHLQNFQDIFLKTLNFVQKSCSEELLPFYLHSTYDKFAKIDDKIFRSLKFRFL